MKELLDTYVNMELWNIYHKLKSPVVTVYVWPSTTALDHRKSKSDYERRMYNSQDSNRFSRSVGHAGISINYNGKFIYRGFGPHEMYKYIKCTNPAASIKATFNSYEEDIRSMQSIPDYKIYLYNLDFERLCNFLESPTGSWNMYNLYTNNCSTFVLKALVIGSGGIKPTIWKRSKRFFDNMFELVKAFAWLFPNIQASQRMYLARIFATDSNPVRAMDHIFKTLGGATPDAVLRYAHFLENYNPKLSKP